MTRNRFLTTAAVAVLGASLAVGPALAFGPGGGPGKGGASMLERYDADGDGTVSRAEFESNHADRFGKADVNADGTLSLEEFNAYVQSRRDDRIRMMHERLDANKDGVVSAEEIDAVSSDRFGRLDRNNDGVITQDEVAWMGKKGYRGRGPGGGAAGDSPR